MLIDFTVCGDRTFSWLMNEYDSTVLNCLARLYFKRFHCQPQSLAALNLGIFQAPFNDFCPRMKTSNRRMKCRSRTKLFRVITFARLSFDSFLELVRSLSVLRISLVVTGTLLHNVRTSQPRSCLPLLSGTISLN